MLEGDLRAPTAVPVLRFLELEPYEHAVAWASPATSASSRTCPASGWPNLASVNPVYVSIGHRVSLETAVHYTLACTTRYKLPETTRWVHRLASG